MKALRTTLYHLFAPQERNNHRPRVLHTSGLFTLSAILLLSTFVITSFSTGRSGLPAILGFSSSISVSAVVAQTNQMRALAGVGPLREAAQLRQAAAAKADHMCEQQYWAHISPKGVLPWKFIKDAGYSYMAAGENLARDFSDTSSMVAAWMASTTHKANIVSARYSDIGIAVRDCHFLGSDTVLVVQMFGSPRVRQATVTTGRTSTRTGSVGTLSRQVQGEQIVQGIEEETEPLSGLTQTESTATALFTPLQALKAVIIALYLIVFFALFIDLWFATKRQIVRVAGKNIAHLIFLSGILFVVLLIRAGVVI